MTRLLLYSLLLAGVPDAAWSQPAPTVEQMVEVDPIRCWWRTSVGAVRIGETFGLTLTCAVLENEAVQVVPDESRLAGAVISLAPFEIVDSAHPQDLRGGERRFFQYDYTLRIINPDAIGSDVPIPIVSIHYRVSSRIAANASVQGRDLTYILPPQSMRVLSLVTADAPDIRDSSDERFSMVEGLTLRAGALAIARAKRRCRSDRPQPFVIGVHAFRSCGCESFASGARCRLLRTIEQVPQGGCDFNRNAHVRGMFSRSGPQRAARGFGGSKIPAK